MAFFQLNKKTQINYDLYTAVLPQTTLFLHGNLASNRWWLPTLETLQKKHQNVSVQGHMICAEFRGCGHSSDPQNESEVQINLFAEDFIALIKNLIHENKISAPINIVGHSTGGLIAAYMLAKAPELFNRGYLLDPVSAEGVTFDHNMIQAFEAMKRDKNLTGVVIGSTIYNNNADSAFFKDILVEDAFKAVKSVGHLVLKALDGLNSVNLVKTIPHKVMVVHGEKDTLLPILESQKFAQLIPQGTFHTLTECGHCGNVENPEKFVTHMSEFLFV